MKVPRSDIMKKILLTIEKHPSSIYDIQYSISELFDPKRSRLPKLLKSMESDGLVVSALQPGPLGPYRRLYELGPNAHEYLDDSLRDAIETLLHFYRNYRQENPSPLRTLGKEPENVSLSGDVLFSSFPHFIVSDLEDIRDFLSSENGVSLMIVGNDEILSKTGIQYTNLGHDITHINIERDMISEIRLRGLPNQNIIAAAVRECKRVLQRNGLLRISVPFVFFEVSNEQRLENFIRHTAISRFPELGITDGHELKKILQDNFSQNGVYETQKCETVFWGLKS